MPDIREITDLSAPELDVYARLSEGQLLHYYEPDTGLFIAESPKVISRALDAGYEPVSLLMEPEHVEGEAREVVSRCGGIPVYTAEARILTELTGFQLTRGVLCAMRRRRLPDAASLCAGARRVAVLENVMNPTNVGAIFRSAAALGMDAVLLTPGCSDPLYRRAARVSMGTVFQVPWTFFDRQQCPWPERGMEALRELGFKTAAMALKKDSVSIGDPALLAEERLAGGAGDRGRRSGGGDHCRLRLYGDDPHGPRGGFSQCGGGVSRGLLGAWEKIRRWGDDRNGAERGDPSL